MSKEAQAEIKPKILRKSYRFALIGLIIGFTGISLASYKLSIESKEPKPSVTHKLSLGFSNIFKKTLDISIQKKELQPKPIEEKWLSSNNIGICATICGLCSLLFGCIAWIRGEHRRFTYTT